MSEFFRIVRGLEIDGSIRILSGTTAPGSSSDADTAPVGSLYLDSTSGVAYTKTSAGTGTLVWTGIGSKILQLYTENPQNASFPVASGINSIALGSESDAQADNSFALGVQSLTRTPGSIMYANGRFGSQGDVQNGKYLLRTVTTSNSETELFVDGTGGSQRLVMPDNCTWTFNIVITGHRQDASNGHAGYRIEGVIYRSAGASTVAFQGQPVKSVLGESDPSWDINIYADNTNGCLAVKAIGQAGKTIRWAGIVETLEVTN